MLLMHFQGREGLNVFTCRIAHLHIRDLLTKEFAADAQECKLSILRTDSAQSPIALHIAARRLHLSKGGFAGTGSKGAQEQDPEAQWRKVAGGKQLAL